MSGSLKSFVSESELEERRKKRQEEWEKVRQPDQPLEAPEEEYDPRSLFERLQEQKDKKQAEWDEAHRLKNMVRGLENDEADFLNLVEETREKIEKKKEEEEKQELSEFYGVAKLQEESLTARARVIAEEPKRPQSSGQQGKRISHQRQLLSGIIKRKRGPSEGDEEPDKKQKTDSNCTQGLLQKEPTDSIPSNPSGNGNVPRNVTRVLGNMPCALQSIGTLPGIGGTYTDSSGSDSDSSSDLESYFHSKKQVQVQITSKKSHNSQ